MTVLHIETPYFESQVLSRHAGRAIWLKMEALQPPGSFKIRGVGLVCQTHAQRGVKRFISSSGGNAGIAVAYAGRQLGISVTVVVPQTTTEHSFVSKALRWWCMALRGKKPMRWPCPC
jgi:L-serine/L-threonine ammonia-lyase